MTCYEIMEQKSEVRQKPSLKNVTRHKIKQISTSW